MTKDDVRTAAKRLVEFHEKFAPTFGKAQAQDNAFAYIKGLMICPERKSIEPIALNVGNGNVSAMQKFINSGPWEHEAVQEDLQDLFAQDLAPTATDSSIGIVGVVDESAFTKKGNKSAGSRSATQRSVGQGRQLPGRGLSHRGHPRGNGPACASVVSARALVRADPGEQGAKESGSCAPRNRVSDQTRDRRGSDPECGGPRLGPAGMDHRRRTLRAKRSIPRRVGGVKSEVRCRSSGHHPRVDDRPRILGAGLLSARPDSHKTCAGSSIPVKQVGASLPAEAWRTLVVGQGTKGPLAFEFAAVRIWQRRHDKPGSQGWLVIRRSLDPKPEIKYYISNAPETTPLEVLARVACKRFRVEEFFEDAKTYLGMAQYETRSWTGWHHHMSLVALAHLFITLVRKDLRKETPALSLDRTVRLLKSAMKLPHLDEDHALWLVDYYVRRNEIARKSHEKTWMARRPHVKLLPL